MSDKPIIIREQFVALLKSMYLADEDTVDDLLEATAEALEVANNLILKESGKVTIDAVDLCYLADAADILCSLLGPGARVVMQRPGNFHRVFGLERRARVIPMNLTMENLECCPECGADESCWDARRADPDGLRAENERLRAEQTAADAVIVYYMAQGWPSYSERECADKIWTDEKTRAQDDAFNRHLARTTRALKEKTS